jgi:hypothetical protein
MKFENLRDIVDRFSTRKATDDEVRSLMKGEYEYFSDKTRSLRRLKFDLFSDSMELGLFFRRGRRELFVERMNMVAAILTKNLSVPEQEVCGCLSKVLLQSGNWIRSLAREAGHPEWVNPGMASRGRRGQRASFSALEYRKAEIGLPTLLYEQLASYGLDPQDVIDLYAVETLRKAKTEYRGFWPRKRLSK